MLQSYDLLDLTITLTPPPENAPADALASMTVRCDALGLNHTAGLLTDPLTPQERADLRWYLEEYSQWPYAEFAVRGKRIEAQLSEIGKRLYQTVFGAVMGQVQPWRLLPTKQRQISIVSTVPAALSLPWELLHDEQGFLVLRTRQPVALLRRLEQHELSELPIAFKPPLRVLVVTARPSGTGFLDPRSLPRELLDAVQSQIDAGAVEVEFLRPPTRAALRQRLAQTKNPVHLLHFDGHGVFASQIDPHDTQRKRGGGQGMLAFEDAEGKLDLVKAEDLAQLLQDSGVKLVVLDACQSAMSADDNAFSSVAARLIQGGVDATVAMSASVLMVSSTRFFARFYRELADGTPVPIAQERARQELYDDPRRHLFRRHADDEGQPVELRDWWLPHFYQQLPLTFRATRVPRKRKPLPSTTLPRFNDNMPEEPRYRFGGRARELLQIERHLLRKRFVVLSGFGGIGKTALAREAADWLTRTRMYTSACFVSFEHGGEATLLLSELGSFLGVNDGSYDPGDLTAALARLQPALQARPTLVIVDNLESILPQGEAPLKLAEREQLWHTLRELARLNAGVLLTSRDPLAGEERLAPGHQVAALPLSGLMPTDAYALASRLLSDLGIERARVPYAAMRDLLARLDHHPLAIQLVLPALREHSLATILADFAQLLPTFVDGTTTGGNRSLLASLNYSLRRLPLEQQALLSRLAIFEGGAFESALLEITQIPEKTWATLRPALEQAALLVAEQVHTAISVPFLHFHPVLVPYLRQQVMGQEDEAQRQRYARYYATLVDSFDYVRQNSAPTYALVRRDLPNLRTALAYLLQADDLGAASHMTSSLAQFLTGLGLIRERDSLRQRMNQIVGASSSEGLTSAVFELEIGWARDEQHSGKIQAAIARLTKLLARVQTLPDGTAIGPSTYAHSHTLQVLGQCLEEVGQCSAAQQHLQEALDLLNAQLIQEPKDPILYIAHANLLGNLGTVYREQERYPQAQMYYEQALQEHRAAQDTRNEAAVLGELGTMALLQHAHTQARSYYQQALQQFQAMGNLEQQASAWHQLGMVAQEQRDWNEAERCYRESLSLQERIGYGYTAGAAGTCNQLAFIAESTGHPAEAEGWFKGALERIKRVEPDGMRHVQFLNNLARLLVNEVQAGHAERTRLTEARSYLEQCRRIEEHVGVSNQTVWTYNLLARIAELEERPEVARDCGRHARESFAACVDNRFQIDWQFAPLIAAIVAAARGDAQARAKVTEALPAGEQRGWHISKGVQLIWQGECDWQVLAEGLGSQEALLLLRVLETLAVSPDAAAKDDESE